MTALKRDGRGISSGSEEARVQRSSFQTEVLSNSCGPLEHVGERHSSAAQGQSPDHRFHSKSIKDFPPPEKKRKKKSALLPETVGAALMEIPILPL